MFRFSRNKNFINFLAMVVCMQIALSPVAQAATATTQPTLWDRVVSFFNSNQKQNTNQNQATAQPAQGNGAASNTNNAHTPTNAPKTTSGTTTQNGQKANGSQPAKTGPAAPTQAAPNVVKAEEDLNKIKTEQILAQEKQIQEVETAFSKPWKVPLLNQTLPEYGQLLAAMGLNQMFWAASSGDPEVMWEWLHSMTSFEFHMSMMVFGGVMGAYNQHILENIHDKLRLKAFLAPFALPLGDIVSNYFSRIYNNPSMQQMFKTFQPGSKFPDPRDPTGKTMSNSPEVRALVRAQLRYRLVRDVMRDFFNGEFQANTFFHGGQMALVIAVDRGIKSRVLTFVNVDKKTGEIDLVFGKHMPKEALEAIQKGLREKAGQIVLENGYEYDTTIQIVKSLKLAKFWEAVTSDFPIENAGRFLKLARWGSGVWGNLIFFVVSDVIGKVIIPFVHNSPRISEIDNAVSKLNLAVDWYLQPGRKENFPLSRLNRSGTEYKWLTYLADPSHYDSQGKLKVDDNFYKFYYGLHGLISQSFNMLKDLAFQRNIDTEPWNDIYRFIAKFSDDYFGKFTDDVEFFKCQGAVTGFIGVITTGGEKCKEKWAVEHAGAFRSIFQKFTADDYISTKLNKVNEAFGKYRSDVLLQDVYEKWNLWEKDVTKTLADQNQKERYFIWISRGMNPNDRWFQENKDLWHIDPKDAFYLANEEANMVVDFDREVLGAVNEYYEASMCQDKGHPLPHYEECKKGAGPGPVIERHKKLYAAWIKSKRNSLNPNTLSSGIAFIAPAALEKPATYDETEGKRVAAILKTVRNPFLEDQNQDPNTQDLLGDVARWVLGGMKDDAFFEKHKNEWNVDAFGGVEAFGKAMVGSLYGDSMLNIYDPQSPQGQNVSNKLTEETWNLLHGRLDANSVSAEDRDLMVLVGATFDTLLKEKNDLQRTLEQKNDKYQRIVTGVITPGIGDNNSWWGKTLQWTRNVLDGVAINPQTPLIYDHGKLFSETYNVFDKGGRNNWNWPALVDWHRYKSLFRQDGARSLPAGTINVFNLEMSKYLEILDRALRGVSLSAGTDARNPEYNALVQSPAGVLTQVKGLLDLFYKTLELTPNLGQQNDLRLSIKTVYQLAAVLGQLNLEGQTGIPEFPPQVTRDQAQAIIEQYMKESPQQRAASKALAETTRQLTNDMRKVTDQFWPGLAGSVNMGKSNGAFVDYIKDRNAMINGLRGNISQLLQMIKARGVGQSTPAQEYALQEKMTNPHLGIPLLGASIGAANTSLKLAQLVGGEIIQAENQKIIQARIGCFMLKDQFCSPSTEGAQ